MASYRDLNVLYRALQLSPIGNVEKLENGVRLEHQAGVGHFLVLRRTDKDLHIRQCQEHLGKATETLILDASYNGQLGQIVESAEQLQEFVVMTNRARVKLAFDLFHDHFEHDVIMGFCLLQDAVFNTPEPVRRRKRLCTTECVVCLHEKANVMMNCGHECVCSACCDEWIKVQQACPICKEPVTDVYKNE